MNNLEYLLLFKMFIFVIRHFTIFFEAQHSTRTKVWVKIIGEHIYQNNLPQYRNRFYLSERKKILGHKVSVFRFSALRFTKGGLAPGFGRLSSRRGLSQPSLGTGRRYSRCSRLLSGRRCGRLSGHLSGHLSGLLYLLATRGGRKAAALSAYCLS